MLPRTLILIAVIVALSVPGVAAAAVPVHFLGDRLVRARLIPESGTVAPGTSTWLAVELTPSPGWHIYWRNPGDSGAPPHIAWSLPRGVSVGGPSWPAPERLITGGITTYVYQHRATLLVPLALGQGVHARQNAAVGADISWFVCSNVCVPGSARTSAHFAIAAEARGEPDHRTRDLFAAARSRLPAAAGFETTFSADHALLHISVPVAAFAGERIAGATFFPLDGKLIAQSAPQHVVIDNRLTLTLQRNGTQRRLPARVDGVLVVDGAAADGNRAHSAYAVSANPAMTVMAERPLSFIAAFVLAFLGGIVLNVMPCVFPVLSFKALGAIEGNASNRRWEPAPRMPPASSQVALRSARCCSRCAVEVTPSVGVFNSNHRCLLHCWRCCCSCWPSPCRVWQRSSSHCPARSLAAAATTAPSALLRTARSWRSSPPRARLRSWEPHSDLH